MSWRNRSIAVALVATLTGTSLPVEPYADLAALAAKLDFSMISHGPARFDPAELESLNARILHAMPYDVAESRLEREARGEDRDRQAGGDSPMKRNQFGPRE